MAIFNIIPNNSTQPPFEVEADSATEDTTSGRIKLHDADSNLVASFINVSFYRLPDAPTP